MVLIDSARGAYAQVSYAADDILWKGGLRT